MSHVTRSAVLVAVAATIVVGALVGAVSTPDPATPTATAPLVGASSTGGAPSTGRAPSPATPPAAAPSDEPTDTPRGADDVEHRVDASPRPVDGCDRPPRTVGVRATNFAFDVVDVGELCAGDSVALTVEEGSHSLTAAAAGIDTGILPSGTTRTAAVDAGPGTYAFRCTLHGQMSGELTIIG